MKRRFSCSHVNIDVPHKKNLLTHSCKKDKATEHEETVLCLITLFRHGTIHLLFLRSCWRAFHSLPGGQVHFLLSGQQRRPTYKSHFQNGRSWFRDYIIFKKTLQKHCILKFPWTFCFHAPTNPYKWHKKQRAVSKNISLP